ncbi:hypothetical protein QL285_042158 [Trifolium repens]|nr:hypothetical protein QL285_042158 [Trifolium repens]
MLQICVASTGFQNQASEKPASNLEVGSLQLASRNVPPLCNDPFCNQLVTIRKHDEQNVKTSQQMELQLKYNFEKEMKKIHD